MALYRLSDRLEKIQRTNFASVRIREREDIQRLLRDQIEVIDSDLLVLAEEFSNWQEGSRRIDLLALDRNANIVVLELKRSEHGDHMELQAIRYAAMVANLTFEQAAQAHAQYLMSRDMTDDAEERILEFLQWDDINEEDFGQDVRVILISADFSRELTTSVLWLNAKGLEIECLRLRPYQDGEQVLIDVQQIIPLPEAKSYIVGVREKTRKEAESRNRDLTKFDVRIGVEEFKHLPKRQTILKVVKAIADTGEPPEKIWDGIQRNFNVTWRVVDGDVNSSEFAARATNAAEAGGLAFDPRRWFFEDTELIHAGGRTYAFSKMWGSLTESLVQQILAKYPNSNIKVQRSE